MIEESLKEYFSKHKTPKLPLKERIKRSVLCGLLSPGEKNFVVKSLEDYILPNKKKGTFFDPVKNNLYYLVDGNVLERRLKIYSNEIEEEVVQDILFKEELFGIPLISKKYAGEDNRYNTSWDFLKDSEVIRIPLQKEKDLIKHIPKMEENFYLLRNERRDKLEDISMIRTRCGSEEKVRETLSFMLNKRGAMSLNGGYSHRPALMKRNNIIHRFGNYSDYGILPKVGHDNLSSLACTSRETFSRVLNAYAFQSNGRNYKLAFGEDSHLFICRYLDDEEGKLVKIKDLKD